MRHILCWFVHDWTYDNPDKSLAYHRKCEVCGKSQSISMNSEWITDDKKEEKNENVDD